MCENPIRRQASRVFGRLLVGASLLGIGLAPGVTAGEITLAWPAAEDDLTVGYRVYVGTEPGVYTRTVDVGDAATARIPDLEDEVVHYLAVKAYDAEGGESPDYSPELGSLPEPRIDGIEPATLAPGEASFVTIVGANFDPDVRLRARDARLTLRSAAALAGGRLLVRLEAAPAPAGQRAGPVLLEPSSFLLINPGRKAGAYFDANPEAVDVDGSGFVDELDVEAVRLSGGARQGDDRYRVEADLDGDGTVGPGDLARVIARLGTPASFRPTLPPPERAAASRAAEPEGDPPSGEAEPAD